MIDISTTVMIDTIFVIAKWTVTISLGDVAIVAIVCNCSCLKVWMISNSTIGELTVKLPVVVMLVKWDDITIVFQNSNSSQE